MASRTQRPDPGDELKAPGHHRKPIKPTGNSKQTNRKAVPVIGVCTSGKRKYESRKIAKVALEASKRSPTWAGFEGDIYRCTICDGWHVTHKGRRHKDGWRLTENPDEPTCNACGLPKTRWSFIGRNDESWFTLNGTTWVGKVRICIDCFNQRRAGEDDPRLGA